MTSQYRDDEESGLREIPPLTDDESETEPQDRNLQVRSRSGSDAPERSLPVWLRESASSFRYKWVPLPLRKAGRATVTFIKGPIPPRELKIEPLFPKLQQAPLRLLDRYVPKRRHRISLLVLFYAVWFLTWSLMLKHHATSGFIKGYGRPSNLWCGSSFWNAENGCGLNGNNCRPFSSAHLAFRCPANCEETHLLEDRIVGNKTLIYTGLVVGGAKANDADSTPIYRGDSFICQAAIHAGVITNANGGCGVASLIGSHSGYEASKHHGIESVDFPSTFPRSFTFQRVSNVQAQCPTDSRWPTFAVTAVALVLLSLFTASPGVFFFSTFIILMFHVGLVSDPPNNGSFYELISSLFGRLLPGTFISYILYITSAIPLLTGLTAQVEKTVLYLGFCFIGALNNYTFAPLIPIERLTPHDLAQPGAKFALATIVTIILVIVITQIHFIRISGNMPKYLAIYATFCVGLLILLLLPGERLRIHHYILALLFMPGTGFQTRPGLVYQGLLLGLFINGVARWGFSSIIQTPAALGEAGGGNGKSWWGAHSPNVTAVVAPGASNITFNWGGLPNDTGIDGVSILINDVERHRLFTDEELYWHDDHVTLQRRKPERDSPELDFYRFAWMNGNQAGRYSNPGIWDKEGHWQDIPTK